MKKLLVLAMMATLLMAGSAFAIIRTVPAPNATFAFGNPGVSVGPTTTNNDDSCDIGVAPAATLLLPYFEVDFNNRTTTTLFTITNVSRFSQIAHVTVWTDESFPVLDFNIFLTGYDVQPINLMDILTTGTVAPHANAAEAPGTGPFTPSAIQPGSPLGNPNLNAAPNYSNPNFSAPLTCGSNPGILPPPLVAAVRTALTTGIFGAGCSGVGTPHANAVGYITVDVASNCTTRLPNDVGGAYFTDTAGGILFDNVLIGDYQQLGPAAVGVPANSFDGAGNAMVHIRAVPEGGGVGQIPGGSVASTTNLPYTFYDRYTPVGNRRLDRRQPLPTTWAARYIQGGAGAFATNYKIWREGNTGDNNTCAQHAVNATLNVSEVVRFDERENPFVGGGGIICSPPAFCTPNPGTLPETSLTTTLNTNVYPALGGTDVGGWMYLNLNNGGNTLYSVTTAGGSIITGGLTSNLGGGTTLVGPRPSQNWVVIEMFGSLGASRLSVDFDAAWLGNGCSPSPFTSTANGGGVPIGPAGGVFVCPPGTTLTNGTVALCTGTNTTPLP